MFDSVLGFVSNNSTMVVGGGVSTMILWVLKKVPNEEIASKVESVFYGLGKALTLGLSSWSATKGIWNKIIEPWFIDLIDNTIGSCVKGFIKGLRSDG